MIATLATVIASQAVISGVFSLTRQAVRLGYLPPMRIIYTSDQESGQIYIPVVNWLLFAAVLIVIISFKHSSNLASAYGIVVTGTMLLSSILLSIVAVKNWGWPRALGGLMLVVMLCIDVPLFGANLIKLATGGWLPVVLGLMILLIMLTWKTERSRLIRRLRDNQEGLSALIESLEEAPPKRVPGTAVFMERTPHAVPLVLLHNLKHNKVLHERVVLLTIVTTDMPYVHNVQRVAIEQLSASFWRVVASYGWRETPNVTDILYRCGLEDELHHERDLVLYVARYAGAGQAALVFARARQGVPAVAAQCAARAGSVRNPAEPGDRTGGAGGILNKTLR